MSSATVNINLDLDAYLKQVADGWGPMSEKPTSIEDLVVKRLLEELQDEYRQTVEREVKAAAEQYIANDLKATVARHVDRILGLPIRQYNYDGRRYDEEPLERYVMNAVQWEVHRVAAAHANRVKVAIEQVDAK